MWCKSCRQDVPAVNAVASETPCCIRCGAVLMARGTKSTARNAAQRDARAPRQTRQIKTAFGASVKATSAPATQPASAATVAPASVSTGSASNTHASIKPAPHAAAGAPTFVTDAPIVALRAPLSAFDTWEVEEQLRHVDRILSGARFHTELQHAADGAQTPGPSSAMKSKLVATAAARQRPRRARRRARAASMLVVAGAVALAAGVVLLSVGAIAGRGVWQSVGLPITLLGQVSLLLGMLLQQLDLVWHGKRETASKLYSFQKRLVDLEALAAELAPATDEESPPAADERALMTELKNRLDTLSHRLNVPCG